MTTYRMPPEPAGPVWQWRASAHRWVRYELDERDGLWHNRTFVGLLAKTWSGLLGMGKVTDFEPIEETLDELKDQIVSAAVAWDISGSAGTNADLREAVGRYHRKRHQINDERDNT